MSSDEHRSDSRKSRQELLDEIYYLRDVAGEREQQLRVLQARMEEILRWTAPVRWLARGLRRFSSARPGNPSDASAPGALRGRVRAGTFRRTARPGTIERRPDDGRRLYVDVTALVLHRGRTGVQRVTREIARALLAAPPTGFTTHLVFAAPRQPYRTGAEFLADFGREGAAGGGHGALMDARPGDVFIGLDHSMQAVVERERDLAELRLRGAGLWFVCNDTLPLDHPEWFPDDVPPAFEAWLRAVLRIADGVACISRTTESRLLQWEGEWHVPRNRPVTLAHFGLGAAPLRGASDLNAASEEQCKALERLQGKAVFLMVGTLEPRKGHAQALEAFNRLWASSEDVALVIVGLPGWMTEVTQRRIRHHEEFGTRLFWFMDASDGLVEQLYRNSTALLAPSEGEGFGLPLVEAARNGLPILCRDLPVFREVAGAHATYFDGRDPDSLARAIRTWMTAWRRREVPDSHGIRCVTWPESAQQLMEMVLQGAATAQSRS